MQKYSDHSASKPSAMQAFDAIKVDDFNVSLNGKRAPKSLHDIGKYISLEEFISKPFGCPFCQAQLLIKRSGEDIFTEKGFALWYCRRCRFWQWYYCYDPALDDCMNGQKEAACISKTREFPDELPSSCNSEIAQYLRRWPDEWHRCEPRQFEKFIADIFRANYSSAEVIHVGKPDDGGTDIIFIDADELQWLIQVKRREHSASSEGVSTVRNLIGTMFLEDAVRGIIVSTADHFTLRACQAANKLIHKGMYVRLIDRGLLDRMLEPVLPDRPWLPVIETYDMNVAALLAEEVYSDTQPDIFH